MSELNHQHTENEKKSSERNSNYWLTLEQWGEDPEFQKMAEQEFQSSPLRESGDEGFGARRNFLKLMGASIALASASCVKRPVQKIIPYAKQPEEVTIGVSNFYTSTWFDGTEGLGILVKTREGRPIKVEGNPLHPLNKGGLSARAQAHILSLYDPERLKSAKKNLLNKERTNRDTISITWESADTEIANQLKKGGVALLTGQVASPSQRSLIREFVQAFRATHVAWEPLGNSEMSEANKESFGEEAIPFYHFDQAKLIVSIGADFLGTWIAPVTFTRQFSANRKDPKKMSKLVSFDPNHSLTGANADLRYKVKPSQQILVVMGLAHDLIVKKGLTRYASDSTLKNALTPFAGASAKLEVPQAEWDKLVDDLAANKGTSLIVAGGLASKADSAKQLQIAVNFLNSALDNEGATVNSAAPFTALTASDQDLKTLIESMNKGAIKTLIIHGTNPVYSLPQSSGFIDALHKVEMVISTADRNDESAQRSHFVMPSSHTMESWGDLETVDGMYSIHQPTLRPLYDTREFESSLMAWAKAAGVGGKSLTGFANHFDFVKTFWKNEIFPKSGKGGDFEDFWNKTLQEGVADQGKVSKKSRRNFKTESLNSVKLVANEGLELVLYPLIGMGDGSLANITWLQELPDPITKVVWDNYASLSLATAKRLGYKQGDVVELEVKNGSRIRLPVHIQPGLHDDVVAVPVGYGRTAAGKVGNGVGANAFNLASMTAQGIQYSGLKLSLKKGEGRHELAQTAGHHSMEGRKIVAEATQAEYLKDAGANNHKHNIFSIWPKHEYKGHKWGMAVDLNLCTGCSACVVACISENNTSIVGKKYVLQGREMHWLRIDRYYSGKDPANARTVFQPVMCQHCDNAPCETVCPVVATVHSSEGLNDMVYNRCVGTRYCANNCPYKVRRFNWFNYAKLIEKPMHMALNPDVTIRPRGVMEKCTFCVQRIKEEKITAKIEDRKLKDGDIKTACQQSCPTDAIVFGDLNDPESRVAKTFAAEPRAYALLEEFHAAPSVRYLTKIRNNYQEQLDDAHHEGGHA